MNETIGARLRQAREQRHLTLDQASETTKIRRHYLEALENDDLSAIPSMAQARGFLRLYAEFLRLDLNALLPAQQPVAPPPEPPDSRPEQETAPDGKVEAAAGIPSAPEPARPGFLAGLRQRFLRRPNDEASGESASSKSETSDRPSTPEPEPFVPARVTEELPEQPQPAPAEPASDENEAGQPAVSKSRTTRRPSRPKRAARTASDTDEKKNVNA